MASNIQFIKNQKGKPALLYDGHKYNWNHTNKNGSVNYKCANRSEYCYASITLNENQDSVLKASEHVCKRHYNQNIRDVILNSCKEEVAVKMCPVKKIFEKAVTELHETDPNFSMCSYNEVKSSLYRARHKALDLTNTEFSRLKDVNVPQILKEDFMVVEDGDEYKILIFSTGHAQQFMVNSNSNTIQYFGDGTFKRVPKPFKQLYTVHAGIGKNNETTNVVPVLFALLPNKTELTYRRLFKLIRDDLGIIMNKFKCDYEVAQINGCKSAFPDVKLSGCFFHYNRAVWKKARVINVSATKEGRKMVEFCAILPLLPESEINNSWVTILAEIPAPVTTPVLKFKKYMEDTWLRLGPEKLSCSKDKHRSNNPVEGWHRRLNIRMPHKPTLIRFLYKLKKEARYQNTRISNYLFSGASRKRCDIVFDCHYKRQLVDLSEGAIDCMQFLENMKILRKRLK